jgi:hypothetical protein
MYRRITERGSVESDIDKKEKVYCPMSQNSEGKTNLGDQI